ncbi:hypothetical protein BC628DRAFT_1409504 [Trametes gibbosa]|nr:hypothetical protein BC628DRAFT_1409504 [Trametes gibbosa]
MAPVDTTRLIRATLTFSSFGFGKEPNIRTRESGGKVIATLRKPAALDALAQKLSADRLRVVKLDVTKPAEINTVFMQVKATSGHVDIVFDCAAHIAIGEHEAGRVDTMEFFRERDTSQVLSALLSRNSAIVGMAGVPVIGFFHTTKYDPAPPGMGQEAGTSLAVAKIIEFSHLFSPPLNRNGLIRQKIRTVAKIDFHESWSDARGKQCPPPPVS